MGIVVDLFAGGGGASTAIEAALERSVDVAINHDEVALAVHRANHPDTEHRVESVWKAFPAEVAKGRAIDVLWASPDCKHFSRSKGGKPKDASVRSLAWVVVYWARLPRWQRPKLICLENVPEFITWGPLDSEGYPIEERAGETFQQWLGSLQLLGYSVEWRMLNAADFGAPTSRKRLFLVATLDGAPVWPQPSHGAGLRPYRTAGECIDFSRPCPSIFPLHHAEATLTRIAHGVMKFVVNHPSPYIVNGYAPTLIQTGRGERKGQRPRYLDLQKPLGTVEAGGAKHAVVAAFLAKHYKGVIGTAMGAPIGTITAKDHHSVVTARLAENERAGAERVTAFLVKYFKTGIAVSLDEPLHTITTKHRFGLVMCRGLPIVDIGLRMVHWTELLRAQFTPEIAADYDMSAAPTEGACIRLIGNSVSPPPAIAVLRANRGDLGLRRAA